MIKSLELIFCVFMDRNILLPNKKQNKKQNKNNNKNKTKQREKTTTKF